MPLEPDFGRQLLRKLGMTIGGAALAIIQQKNANVCVLGELCHI